MNNRLLFAFVTLVLASSFTTCLAADGGDEVDVQESSKQVTSAIAATSNGESSSGATSIMEDAEQKAAEDAQIAEDLENEAMLEREIYGDAVDEESDNMDAGLDQKETNKKEAEQDEKEANTKEAEQDEMVQDKPEETNGDKDLYNEDENEPQEEPEETNEDEEMYEQPQDGETDPETEDEAYDNEMQMDAIEKQGNDPFGDYEAQASNADDANEDYWPVLGQYGEEETLPEEQEKKAEKEGFLAKKDGDQP